MELTSTPSIPAFPPSTNHSSIQVSHSKAPHRAATAESAIVDWLLLRNLLVQHWLWLDVSFSGWWSANVTISPNDLIWRWNSHLRATSRCWLSSTASSLSICSSTPSPSSSALRASSSLSSLCECQSKYLKLTTYFSFIGFKTSVWFSPSSLCSSHSSPPMCSRWKKWCHNH